MATSRRSARTLFDSNTGTAERSRSPANITAKQFCANCNLAISRRKKNSQAAEKSSSDHEKSCTDYDSDTSGRAEYGSSSVSSNETSSTFSRAGSVAFLRFRLRLIESASDLFASLIINRFQRRIPVRTFRERFVVVLQVFNP